MSQYIIPFPQSDPHLFSHVSQAFSLVDLGKRLLDAAKNGDVDEVRNLISSGAPFTTDWLGISPLHFAAMNGHLSTCEALLRAGISRDARTKVDRTPLHLAAQEGHADIVELLLKNGAELEAKDMLRMTALHWAAERGHSPVVQVLMRFGADVQLQNKFELTPLEIAVAKDHSEARDSMLQTQLDIVSSVGKMAAPTEDITSANAYILTDEETLIPAAPPADEVTVTTVPTVSEESDFASSKAASDIPEITLEHCPNVSHIKPEFEEDRQWQATDDPIATIEASDVTSSNFSPLCVKSEDIDVVQVNGFGGDTCLPTDQYNAHSNSSLEVTLVNSLTSDLPEPPDFLAAALEQPEDDLNANTMVVETPDGRILYVRQQPNATSNSLAIFNEDGLEVHDPALLSQVVNAVATLPNGAVCSNLSTHSDEANRSDGNDTLINCNGIPSNGRMGDDLSGLVLDQSSDSLLGAVSSGVDAEPYLNDDNNPVHSLVAQLAIFARDPSQASNCVCVEGVGENATRSELFDWCSNHEMIVSHYENDIHFTTAFLYDEQEFSFDVVYDSQAGSLTFHHALSPLKG